MALYPKGNHPDLLHPILLVKDKTLFNLLGWFLLYISLTPFLIWKFFFKLSSTTPPPTILSTSDTSMGGNARKEITRSQRKLWILTRNEEHSKRKSELAGYARKVHVFFTCQLIFSDYYRFSPIGSWKFRSLAKNQLTKKKRKQSQNNQQNFSWWTIDSLKPYQELAIQFCLYHEINSFLILSNMMF